MVANLKLQLTIQEDAVVVPEAALMSNGDMNFVFVVGQDLTVAMRTVVVGQRMPRWAAIASGIAEGEKVVVEGHQKIGPGMKVGPGAAGEGRGVPVQADSARRERGLSFHNRRYEPSGQGPVTG